MLCGPFPGRADEAKRVDKPIWQIGDCWQVKCPIMYWSPPRLVGSTVPEPVTPPRKVGEYTVALKVIAVTKVLGEDCYVVEIRPGEDLPQSYRHTPFVIALRAYYRTRDLMLMRSEKLQSEHGIDYVASYLNWNARLNAPPEELSSLGWSLPLQLPVFPVQSGKTSERYVRKYDDSSILEAQKKGENVCLSGKFMWIPEPVTPQQEPELKTEGIKVSLIDRRTYSRSGDHDKVRLEEVWVPGKAWWSSVKIWDEFTKSPKEFLLVDPTDRQALAAVPTSRLPVFADRRPLNLTPPAGPSGNLNKDLAPPILRVISDYSFIHAYYRDAGGIDAASVKILVDNIDCTPDAFISHAYLNLEYTDDGITPDLDACRALSVEVKDTFGNLQRLGVNADHYDPSGIDPGNPSPALLKISYQLYREGEVLIKIRENDGEEIYRQVKLHQTRGPQSFTWDGRDEPGNLTRATSYLVEIFYCDVDPLEPIGYLEGI